MPENKSASDVFRKPLGLLLAGGGALGAWQAGVVDELVRRGLVFDKIMGFSAGALTGARYGFGWPSEVLEKWRNIENARVYRFSPRLWPLSLFSDASIWEELDYIGGEEKAKTELRCELIVRSLCIDDWMPVYSRFTPHGAAGWDGPLKARIAASCSMPLIFPPARISENGAVRTYTDGGVPGREWMRCDALAGCADVIVIEMVRPEEIGRRSWTPWGRHDQKAREIMYRQIVSGIDSLQKLPRAPRIFQLRPSRTLDFSMLSFRSRYCAPALEQGVSDAGEFLSGPNKFIAAAQIPPLS